MIKPVRILGIAGSLRRESYNRAVLRAATQLVPEGASIENFLAQVATLSFFKIRMCDGLSSSRPYCCLYF